MRKGVAKTPCKCSSRREIYTGEARGLAIGEDRFAALLTKLKSMGRNDDVDRVIIDKTYRKELMKELAIQ